MTIYPIEKIRSDFPILTRKVNNNLLVYLDNAASAQKPNVVIDSQKRYYSYEYAAAHRGIYTLSNESTTNMEKARIIVSDFINAASPEEIVFVKNTTEGINLVSNSWGRNYLNVGDNIIITEMEHHSNIIPWKILARDKKLTLKFIPLLPDGTLDFSKIYSLIDKQTKLLAITQLSNVLGTLNPLSILISKVREMGNIVILIDGAQAIVHQKIDVQELDCDFYVFSGHKLYGPSGIGVLYGKKHILNNMPPWETGGGMVQTVSLQNGVVFKDVPWCFEAGSPNVCSIIGLGVAINYINSIGMDVVVSHESTLMLYAVKAILKNLDVILYGPESRIGVLAFNLKNCHAYDVGSLLDQYGVAIRTGHHCAMPLLEYFKVSSICRVSFAMYSSVEDIDYFIESLIKVKKFLNRD